mgnify:CR=1 FL=1
MSKERLEALRKKKRLAELRAKQKKKPEVIPTQTVEKDIEVSQADAVLRGAAQGASLELLDEGIAAYETGKEVISNVAGGFMEQGLKGAIDAAPNIAESYREHKEDQEKHLKKLKEEHPVAYMGGNVAGLVANSAATLGLGAYVHGANAVRSGIGAMGIIGGAGFVHGVGSSESDKLEDWLSEGKEGAGAAMAGEMLLPGAKALKSIEKTKLSGFLQYLGVKSHIADNALQTMGKKVDSWGTRCLNYVDEAGEKLFAPFKNRIQLADDVADAANIEGAKMGSILKKIDDTANLNIDAQSMYADITDYVLKPFANTIDPNQLKSVKAVDSKLRQAIFKNPNIDAKTQLPSGSREVNPNMSLSNLHAWKSNIYRNSKTVKRSGDPKIVNQHMIEEAVADRLTEHVDNIVATSSDILEGNIAKEYTTAKQKFGDLREASKLLNKSMHKDKGAQILADSFNDKVFKAAALFQMSGNPGIGLRKAGIAAMGLRAVSKHPGVNGVIAQSANRISKAITAAPDTLNTLARSLMSAASISGEAFMEELLTAGAKVDLAANPLARSTEEVIRRKDSVLTILHSKNPAIASRLRAAIESKNVPAIRQIMSTYGKGRSIQSGIGWDGMAVTAQDKQAVNTWLQSVKSPRKRMMLTTQFAKDSIIPQEMYLPEQPEPMKQFIYSKRRNKIDKPEL